MLSQTNYIGPVASVSILGYSLMPVTFLAAVSVFVSLRSVLGVCLALSCVLWSTTTASRFFEAVRVAFGFNAVPRVTEAEVFGSLPHFSTVCLLYTLGRFLISNVQRWKTIGDDDHIL